MPATPPSVQRAGGSLAYCLLACFITWFLAAPAALAFVRHAPLTPLAVAGAGLSAFGPLIAALLVARSEGRATSVFKPFRAPFAWVALGLFAPMLSHLAATALYALVFGPPAQWFHPPVTSEHLAALVVFAIGEEFGWRGFLQPRWAQRYGAVGGSLLVGLIWGVWHLAYSITPESGGLDVATFVLVLIKLPLWSVIIAWVLERAQGGLAVALAFHAGAHLDNLQRALPLDLHLHALHITVLAVGCVLAARALTRSHQKSSESGLEAAA